MAITNSIGATKKHIELAFADRKFLAELKQLEQPDYDSDAHEALFERFGFKSEDFKGTFFWGEIYIPPFENKATFKAGQLTYHHDINKIVAIIEPTVHKEDMKDLWRGINVLKKKNGLTTTKRITAPGDKRAKLFYAVFKQRSKDLSWKQIYDHYVSHALTYNDEVIEPEASIGSEIELQKAYRRASYRSSLK